MDIAAPADLRFPQHSLNDPAVRHLTAGWLLLAVTALAIATVCAVLLTAARIPWLSTLFTSADFFGRALVVHVTLAVVVWFLACSVAFWTLASGTPGGNGAHTVRWTALTLATFGLVATVASLFVPNAQPVLANYVPVLNHPAFLTGLALFAAGVTLSGAASLPSLWAQRRSGAVWRLGAGLSLVAATVALGTWMASVVVIEMPETAARFEFLAWGPGHVLQFVHVILLMSVWSALGEQWLGHAVAPQRWLHGLLLLAAAPLLAVPIIYFSYSIGDYQFRRAFTLLMSVGVWPAAAVLALRLLQQLTRRGRSVWADPHALALLLSAVLFLLGCGIGALIENDSTMVPAHYHGTVGAVTLAYMAMGYRLLPAFGARIGSDLRLRSQLLCYGIGLMVLALALAWSGSMGVPRKTLHINVMMEFPSYFLAMGLVGLGGLMAITGASLFVVNVVHSLRLGWWRPAQFSARRDIRWRALALTCGLTLVLGILLTNWTPDQGSPLPAMQVGTNEGVNANANAHATQMRAEEIKKRFGQSVTLLNSRQFEAAVTQLHRVLELAPQMPEAHVNMGFAMIGTHQYAAARDFFVAAIELNVSQLNAYYGLGIALEGLNDQPGAIGAMQTYVHLSKPDDPFRVKAETTLRKLRESLRVRSK